jgi:hypothetical protein
MDTETIETNDTNELDELKGLVFELKAENEMLQAENEVLKKKNQELDFANMRLRMILIIHTKTAEHIRKTIVDSTDKAREIEAKIPKDL